MKIAFVSNFYNHHQAFISRQLYLITKGNYRFISTTELPQERKLLGYNSIGEDFVIHYSSSTDEANNWINTADVVVFGAAPPHLLDKRRQEKKLVFRYSEHLFKKGFQWWKYPYRWIRMHRSFSSASPMYMLCASGFTASDYSKMGLFKGKTYKWGYFPECKNYDDLSELMSRKDTREILWCGRFLNWKHPNDILKVAKRLKEDGEDFKINVIGTGVMEDELKRFVSNNYLGDVVSFLGSTTPENVRKHMEHAGIYAFTSDHNEGWGAVLNESMNSGCAVVASNEIGAVPYLLEDNKNGLIYESENVEVLYGKIKHLLNNPTEQKRLGENACRTITSGWNAQIAAERLVELAKAILAGDENPDLFASGPCSRA